MLRPTLLHFALIAGAAALAGACGDEQATRPTDVVKDSAPARSRMVVPVAASPIDGAASSAAKGRCRLVGKVTRDGKSAAAAISLFAAKPRDRAGDGRPWSAGELYAPPDAAARCSAQTVDGMFELTDFPHGRYRLEARGADGVVATCGADFVADGERQEIELRLAAAEREETLRGRVLGIDGAPFVGYVTASDIGPRQVFEFGGDYVGDKGWRAPSADGSFELRHEAGPRIVVVALVPGRLRVVGPAAALPTSGEYVLDLSKATCAVRVRVIDEISGAPVKDAEVVLRGDDVCCADRTDAVGGCVLRAGRDRGSLSVRAAGYPAVDFVELRSRQDSIDVPLRAGPTVRVRVVRADDGRPVEGAPVHVRPPGGRGGPPAVRTASDGVATVTGALPGEAQVYVMGNGWFSEGLELGRIKGQSNVVNNRAAARPPDWLPAAGTVEIELRAMPAAAVEGVVLRHDGTPVAAALVTARAVSKLPYLGDKELKSSTVATGADGRFRAEGLFPSARYALWARADGEPGDAKVEVDPRAAAPVSIRFSEPHWLDVAVLEDVGGSGLADAAVECVELRDKELWLGHETTSTRTDSDGRARLGPLLAGEYQVAVVAKAHVVPSGRRVRFGESDASVLPLTFRLARGGTVRGRALLPDGAAPQIGQAAVGANPALGNWLRDRNLNEANSATLGPDGSFEIGGLAAGTHMVKVAASRGAEEFDGWAQVDADGASVEIRLTAREPERDSFPLRDTFTVRVLGPDGKPVGKADMSATWTNGMAWTRTSLSVVNGVAALPTAMRGGDVTVSHASSLTGIGLDAGPLSARIPTDAPDGYELRLPPGQVVTGRVVDEKGAPLASVRVDVRPKRESGPFSQHSPDPIAGAVTARDGSFEVRGLGGEEYELSVEPTDDFQPAAAVPVQGGRGDVEVRLVRGLRPTIVVLGPDDRPVAGAQVTAAAGRNFFEPDEITTETDAEGRTTLPALSPAKTYRLRVSKYGSDLDDWSEDPWTPAAERTVRLARLLAVAGVVRRPDGRPAPHVGVWYGQVDAEGRMRRGWEHVAADDAGAFRIEGLSEGTVRLAPGDYGMSSMGFASAQLWGLSDGEFVASCATSVQVGSTGVVLVLDAKHLITVKLPDLPGPIPAEDVPDLRSDRQRTTYRPTVADGGLVYSGVKPETDLELWARIPRYGLVGHASKIAAGTEITLRLERGTALEGRVVPPAGAKVGPKVSVSFAAPGVSATADVDSDGRFVIPCLPRVEGEVSAWGPGGRVSTDWNLRATPGTPVEIAIAKSR